jgi:Flp pilus assembly protein TadG
MMLCRNRRPDAARRWGAAAVELAFVLPVLAFLFVAAIDFGRVFHHCVIISNCARDGALYGSQGPTQAADTAGIQAVALADADGLSPTPTVTTATGTDAANDPYIKVTVTCPFTTLTWYPGIPKTTDVTRTVQMRIAPTTPKNP